MLLLELLQPFLRQLSHAIGASTGLVFPAGVFQLFLLLPGVSVDGVSSATVAVSETSGLGATSAGFQSLFAVGASSIG